MTDPFDRFFSMNESYDESEFENHIKDIFNSVKEYELEVDAGDNSKTLDDFLSSRFMNNDNLSKMGYRDIVSVNNLFKELPFLDLLGSKSENKIIELSVW